MDNNDILIRIRYALNLKDGQMLKIFKLGGVTLTEDEIRNMLIKSGDDDIFQDKDAPQQLKCNNRTLDAFLNGLIVYKRGQKEGQEPMQPIAIKQNAVNNVVMKKLKIALSLTSEEMLDILASSQVVISKSELSAVLRKEGQKNYKQCGDRYLRNFLRGLTLKLRG